MFQADAGAGAVPGGARSLIAGRASQKHVDAAWVASQKRTFTAWANAVLDVRGEQIDDVVADLADGCALVNLAELLTGQAVRGRVFNPAPSKFHALENISRALALLEAHGVRSKGLRAEDIHVQNEKLVLGFIWMLIRKFQLRALVSSPSMASTSSRRSVSSTSTTPGTDSRHLSAAKEAMVLWLKQAVAAAGLADAVPIHRLTSCLADGRVLSVLVAQRASHDARVSLPDLLSLPPAERLERAVALADTVLRISPMLDLDQVLTDTVDEASVLTYLSFFHMHDVGARADAQALQDASSTAVVAVSPQQQQQKQHHGQQHEDLVAQLRDEIAALRTELDNAQEQVREMEGQTRHLQASTDAVQDKLIAALQDASSQRAAVRRAHEDASAREAEAAQQRHAAALRLEQAHSERDDARDAAEQARADVAAKQQRIEALAAQVAELSKQREDDVMETERVRQALVEKLDVAEAKHDAAIQRLAAEHRCEIDALELQLSERTQEAEALFATGAKAEKQLAELEAQLADTEERAATASASAEGLTQQHAEAERQATVAQQRSSELEQVCAAQLEEKLNVEIEHQQQVQLLQQAAASEAAEMQARAAADAAARQDALAALAQAQAELRNAEQWQETARQAKEREQALQVQLTEEKAANQRLTAALDEMQLSLSSARDALEQEVAAHRQASADVAGLQAMVAEQRRARESLQVQLQQRTESTSFADLGLMSRVLFDPADASPRRSRSHLHVPVSPAASASSTPRSVAGLHTPPHRTSSAGYVSQWCDADTQTDHGDLDATASTAAAAAAAEEEEEDEVEDVVPLQEVNKVMLAHNVSEALAGHVTRSNVLGVLNAALGHAASTEQRLAALQLECDALLRQLVAARPAARESAATTDPLLSHDALAEVASGSDVDLDDVLDSLAHLGDDLDIIMDGDAGGGVALVLAASSAAPSPSSPLSSSPVLTHGAFSIDYRSILSASSRTDLEQAYRDACVHKQDVQALEHSLLARLRRQHRGRDLGERGEAGDGSDADTAAPAPASIDQLVMAALPSDAVLPLNFHAIEPGVYQFGTKRLRAEVSGDQQIVVRVGGGYMLLAEFVQRYGYSEAVKQLAAMRRRNGTTVYRRGRTFGFAATP